MPHKDPVARREYMREYLRERRKDPEFRKKANRRTMESRDRTKDGHKKHAAAMARYKAKYPDRIKAILKKTDQLPHRVEMHKQWIKDLSAEDRSELQRKWRITRRLRSHANGGKSTTAQWEQRCTLYGSCCAYCGSFLPENKIEIEHIIPVAKGGSNWPANLAPACRTCNTHKSTYRWKPKLPKPRSNYFQSS